MQTFLPYPDFDRSAAVLDVRRLGKQRVEALQVLNALHRSGHGWRHHPVVKMWAGYDEALVTYGDAVCRRWLEGRRADTCRPQILAYAASGRAVPQDELARAGMLPPWLGDPAFHRSHQAALVRKQADHYGPRFPGVPADLPYVWPARVTSDSPGRS